MRREKKGNDLYYRRETVMKEEEAQRTWKAKYDPWLINEYKEVRSNTDIFFFFFFCLIKLRRFIEDV